MFILVPVLVGILLGLLCNLWFLLMFSAVIAIVCVFCGLMLIPGKGILDLFGMIPFMVIVICARGVIPAWIMFLAVNHLQTTFS